MLMSQVINYVPKNLSLPDSALLFMQRFSGVAKVRNGFFWTFFVNCYIHRVRQQRENCRVCRLFLIYSKFHQTLLWIVHRVEVKCHPCSLLDYWVAWVLGCIGVSSLYLVTSSLDKTYYRCCWPRKKLQNNPPTCNNGFLIRSVLI